MAGTETDSAERNPTTGRCAQAAVIGDAEAEADVLGLAARVGVMLASRSITLITGGRGGVMEAACRAAFQHGGTTLGILPSTAMDDANPWCTIVIPTGLGHARNALTALAADMVIAVGGGAGTLSELCFAWIHGRSIYLMDGSGGWSDRLPENTLDHRARAAMVRCEDISSLEDHVIDCCRAQGLKYRDGRPGTP